MGPSTLLDFGESIDSMTGGYQEDYPDEPEEMDSYSGYDEEEDDEDPDR